MPAQAASGCKGRQAGEYTSSVLFQIALRRSLLYSVARRLSVGLQIHRPTDHNLLHNGNAEPTTDGVTPAAALLMLLLPGERIMLHQQISVDGGQ